MDTFCKGNVGRFAEQDLKCGGNVWYINYETIVNKEQKLHNDRFPVELPERCIKLSGIKKGSLVLDPFSGSGTTGVACKNLGMNYIGFEIPNKFVVGYGLDYNGFGRNLPSIYSLVR